MFPHSEGCYKKMYTHSLTLDTDITLPGLSFTSLLSVLCHQLSCILHVFRRCDLLVVKIKRNLRLRTTFADGHSNGLVMKVN